MRPTAAAAAAVLLLTVLMLGNVRAANPGQSPALPQLQRIEGAVPRNIVFILTDDHRYDVMGFMGHPFVETPHIDSIAKNGIHLKNAFVTTSLCSPSRASILTGQYAHRHKVVDNSNPIPPNTIYYSRYLQRAGYHTAFVGKWHMGGESDDPQPGFDHWVSFRGQGTYLPNADGLNVDGRRVPQKGYITDELTDYALAWLEKRPADKPFALYLSHKGVHSNFTPAPRHAGRYRDKPFPVPETMPDTPENYEGKPMWLKNQRNSHHGVDFPYHGQLDIAEYYRRYCETLLAVDDSVGRVLDWLKRSDRLRNTLVIYMGDNGFMFGEHGLIDKRTAYEESIRVPMVAMAPGLIKPGTTAPQVVANIDLAPTFLEAAGLKPPDNMDGKSLYPVLRGDNTPWRDSLLYEYFWERTFPQTPTMHAIRTDRYKFIRYQGIWDIDELYDIQADPKEKKNLILDPKLLPTIRDLNRRLYAILGQTDGLYIPLNPDRTVSQSFGLRSTEGSRPADFPPHLMRKPMPQP
jgi:N-acetylglucosamine-6-sulfatase